MIKLDLKFQNRGFGLIYSDLGSLARQSCPAVLPGSLARQSCPAVLPGSLAQQSFPGVLPSNLNMLNISKLFRLV
jgi:hypothetical protein